MVDPVAASVLGFIIASCYAILLTRPKQLVNVLAGSIVDGIKDISGVLFLFPNITVAKAELQGLPENAIIEALDLTDLSWK